MSRADGNGARRGQGIVPLLLAWLVIAAVVIGTNLATGGELSLDSDVLRYDGNAIGVQVRDFGDQTKAEWEAAVLADPVAERSTVYVAQAFALVPDKRTFYALAIGQLLTILGGALCLERLLRRGARRQVFADQGAWWLRGLAGCVAVGAIALPVLMHRFEDHLLARGITDSDGPLNIERLSHGPGQAPFVIVVVLLVLATAWRRGAALREDVEATV